MSKKEMFFLGVLAVVIIGLLWVALIWNPLPAGAHEDWPTSTPTPTPIKPTPTPLFHYGCNDNKQCVFIWGEGENSCNPDEEGSCYTHVTPTPTPTITPIPTVTATPSAIPISTPSTPSTPSTVVSGCTQNCGGETSSIQDSNACVEPIPSDVPSFTVVVSSTGMTLEWAPIPGANSVDVRYGLQSGSWIYGILNLPNTGSYTVTDLTPNTTYWYEIAGQNGCAIGNWSSSVDPIWE